MCVKQVRYIKKYWSETVRCMPKSCTLHEISPLLQLRWAVGLHLGQQQHLHDISMCTEGIRQQHDILVSPLQCNTNI